MARWFALVAFITGALITKEWKNIRKLGKEDLIIGIISGIITITVLSLMFAGLKWLTDRFPGPIFGTFGICLFFRFIQVNILPKLKGKKKPR